MEPVLYSVIGILMSSLVTGAGAWLAFGRDRMPRREVERYVQEHSPWTKDRGEVTALLRTNAEAISRLDDRLGDLRSEMIAEIRSLGDRIEGRS